MRLAGDPGQTEIKHSLNDQGPVHYLCMQKRALKDRPLNGSVVSTWPCNQFAGSEMIMQLG